MPNRCKRLGTSKQLIATLFGSRGGQALPVTCRRAARVIANFLRFSSAATQGVRLNSAATNLGGFSYNAIARLKPGSSMAQLGVIEVS